MCLDYYVYIMYNIVSILCKKYASKFTNKLLFIDDYL